MRIEPAWLQVDSFNAHKVRRYKHVQNALGLNEASKLSVRIARVKVDRCLPFTVIRQRFLNLTLFHDVIRRKVALPPISQFAHPPIFTVDEKNRDDVSRLNSQFIRSAGIIRVHGYNLLDESGKRKTMSKASVISDRNVKDREEKWINKKKKKLSNPIKFCCWCFGGFQQSWVNIHVWGVFTNQGRSLSLLTKATKWIAHKPKLPLPPSSVCDKLILWSRY